MAITLGSRATPLHLIVVRGATGHTRPLDPGQPGRVVSYSLSGQIATVMFWIRQTPYWAEVPASVLENPGQFRLETGPDHLVLIRLAKLDFLTPGQPDVPDRTLNRYAAVLQINDQIDQVWCLTGPERVVRQLVTPGFARQWIDRVRPDLLPELDQEGFLLCETFVEPRSERRGSARSETRKAHEGIPAT